MNDHAAGEPTSIPLPALGAAGSQLQVVTVVLIITGSLACGATIAAWWASFVAPSGSLIAEAGLLAAIAWLVVAGFAPAWLLARTRLAIAQTADVALVVPTSGAHSLFGKSSHEEMQSVLSAQRARLVVFARFLQIPLGVLPLLIAGATVIRTWPGSSPMVAGELQAAGIGLLLAFPLLILERILARSRQWVDALRLAQLSRCALALLVAAALATGVHAFGITDAYWGQRLVSASVVLIGGELLIRSVVLVMLPPPTAEAAQLWVSGALLRVISGLAGGGGARRIFRLDLSQSWGLQFLGRASGPLLLIVLLIAWATTAVAVLGVGERGVVEQLGRPVAVVGPGMHGCLPWPFGAIRRVENGQVHEVALALGTPLAAGVPGLKPPDAAGLKPEPRIMAEDQPPAEFDRLWEKSHRAESVFLVPSHGAGERGQSFQLLNSDVRVIWRVAESEAGALGAAYRVADPSALVRAIATRALTAAFQQRTLTMVITGDREALAAGVRSQVQGELDALQSGIEIPSVVIDAIHPPPGAAVAYHGVQAAGIIAATDINIARSQQVRTRHEADLTAITTQRGREALAREIAAKAESERARFTADLESATVGGEALALERWLQALAKALGRTQLTIVDDRLRREDAPFLDYRQIPLPTSMPIRDQP
jgi:regulator of protease activity HflC (stomatin/prohibitin superfamily)